MVKDERDPDIEHFIQFSMSLRGKPAIMGECWKPVGFGVDHKSLSMSCVLCLRSKAFKETQSKGWFVQERNLGNQWILEETSNGLSCFI